MSIFRRSHAVEGDGRRAETFPPLASVESRVPVRVTGRVFRVKTRPARGMPSLEVTLVDDSGSVTVEWSGRRSLGGVGLGRRLVVEGVPRHGPRGVTFFNPDYELR